MPLFDKFLHDSWGHNDDYQQRRDALQEALYVSFMGRATKYQRAFLLYGLAQSGKSVLLEIIGSLFPEEAFYQALGNKLGIERYAFVLPMDDCLAQVAIDFGGRSWLVWNAEFKREKIGELPTEMFYHFFKSFSDSAKCNLNISVEGENEHHKIESIFKAFAKVLRNAVAQTDQNFNLPSTKGTL